MKKLVLLIGVILTLSSCSISDDTDSVSQQLQLVKKMTTDGWIQTYTYDGFKFVKRESNIYISDYRYTGDFIGIVKDSTNGGYNYRGEYLYEDDRVKSTVVKCNNGTVTDLSPICFHKEYTYNADGTIIVQNYNGDNYDNPEYTYKYTFQNGNIVKEEVFHPSGENVAVTVYEYDTKNTPFKNILGYDKLQPSSKNNVVKSTKTWGSGSDMSTIVITNAYTYDHKGYPLKVQETSVYTASGVPHPATVSNTTYEYE